MNRLYELTVVVPPGTAMSAPLSVPWLLEDATLSGVNITVPDGHNGLTGIRILWSNQQIIPWGNLSYLVANNRTIPVGFDDYMTVSGLVVVAYNLDVFTHSFYLEATITDVPSTSQIANASGDSSSVLPATTNTTVDPLSPAALIASVPASALASLDLSAVS